MLNSKQRQLQRGTDTMLSNHNTKVENIKIGDRVEIMRRWHTVVDITTEGGGRAIRLHYGPNRSTLHMRSWGLKIPTTR